MSKRMTLKVNTQKKKDKLDNPAFQSMLSDVVGKVMELVKSRIDSKLDSLSKLGQAIAMDFQYNLRKDYQANWIDGKPQKKADYCQGMFNLNSVQYDNILIGVTRKIPVELWQTRTHQNFLKPLLKATDVKWSEIDKAKRETLLNPNQPIEEKENLIVNIAKEKGLEVLTEKRTVTKGTFSKANINGFTEGQLKCNPFAKARFQIPVYEMDKKTNTLKQKDKLIEGEIGDVLSALEPACQALNIAVKRAKKQRDDYLESQKKLATASREVVKKIVS